MFSVWFRIVALAAALAAGAIPAFGQGGTLRAGLASLPSEVDPATALDGAVPLVAQQVFDTLVQYVQGGSDIEPGLAAEWMVSRDGLVWSFRLRSGVRFHDGTALTAQHVVESLGREIFPGHALAPGRSLAGRLLRGMPGVVKEIRAKDARTVEIILHQPYAPLVTVLAHPVFSIVLPATPGASGNRWQGTGPFAVTEIGTGRMVLDAKPGHWRGGPRLGRIVFAEAADEAQAQLTLDAQGLDVYFPAGAPSRPTGAVSMPGWHIGYLALQTEKEPFKRVKVRRAIAAALDPGLIASALGPVASPLQAFLPGGVWGRRDGPPLMGADPERARRLLVEAGLTASATATLVVPELDKRIDQAKVAEAIRTALGAAGFGVTAQIEPSEAALTLAQTGEHQMLIGEGYVAGGDPHFLLYSLSASEGAIKGASAVNFSFYRDGRLDDLLIRASQLSFRPERQRLYVRAQAMLADALPWIPLYVRMHWAVARPEVRSLRLHPSGNPRLDRVWLDTTTAR
ncbi:MAG TPA: ABC transporter substrate-binding protein [Methylomirabilota bacterium]|jgi:peptide/nickel transport system substrate-binding protein|nr:ABC transporter substrate-binding protein [Methylomirabilota bacterium]